jgi:hypothetical protein
MKKYSFIAEVNKGTYVSQFVSENLETSLLLWIPEMENLFGIEVKNYLLSEIEKGSSTPTPLKGIDNIWHLFLVYKKYKFYVHIILTA